MADEYDLRKDIDDLQRIIDDIKEDLNNKVSFKDENSELQVLDDNSLDYIVETYYGGDSSGGDGDLSDYVKKSDVDISLALEPNGTISIGLDLGDGF